MKTLVIINEQHTLLPQQEEIILDKFGEFSFMKVPASGWTSKEIAEKTLGIDSSLKYGEQVNLVFASPIPLMIKLASFLRGVNIYILHNDRREKKELPNGKVIFTVAQEGWQIL